MLTITLINLNRGTNKATMLAIFSSVVDCEPKITENGLYTFEKEHKCLQTQWRKKPNMSTNDACAENIATK